jgi:hypothetical protein
MEYKFGGYQGSLDLQTLRRIMLWVTLSDHSQVLH